MEKILVLPNSRVLSMGSEFPLMTAEEAFVNRHATDAHATMYSLPGSADTPRLRLGHLSDLIGEDKEPLLNWVFVDVDNEGHKRWSADEAEQHWLELTKNPFGPEIKNAGYYSTRGGYRLVFSLADPIPCSLASHYIQQFYAYLESVGIPVDPMCIPSWNTLFRLPRVEREGESLESHIDISRAKTPLAWFAPLPLKRNISPSGALTKRTKRPALKPVGDLGWAVLAGCEDSLPVSISALREGEPIAAKGARQTTMFKLAATIIGRLELDTPHLAYQVMAASIVATGGVSLDDLWDRCCYLVDIDKTKRKAKEKIKEQVENSQPPIVYYGSAYYVHDTSGDTYRPPVPSPAVCQALEQWCRLPGLQTRTKNGKPRGISEYLADYSRQAVEVIVEMGRKKGIFLPEVSGGTLIEGCCVTVDIPAEFNADIAKWLELFANEHHEKLLDWLATSTTLSQPTCAIYIEGPPATGKGLFASGVASLWGSGATSYSDAVGKFNGALSKNPVVLVDEMFQAFDGGDGFSGAFRTLIGESSRQLRRKNLPSSTIRGCPRLIITANNGSALQLTENLGKDDLLAIAERILHIKHGEAPRQFIASMGGRRFTADWVIDKQGKPGKFSKHIQYLVENRRTSPGTRFLVAGVVSDWHRDLMGNSGIQGATLAALAHWIDRNQTTQGLEVQGEYIYVNSPALRGQWGLLMGDKPPREGTLAGALRTLAGGKQTRRNFKVGRLRCYRIELLDVIRRAESLQIGDVEKFENLYLPTTIESEIEDLLTN